MGKEVHITVALLSLIADLALIIPFYLNRKHYLVNYNGFKLNLYTSLLTTFTMVFNAIFYMFEMPCIFNAIVIAIGASIPMAYNCGRYYSNIIMNKVNVLKTQILTIETKNTKSDQNFLDMNYNIQQENDINIEKKYIKKYFIPICCFYAFIISSSFILSIILNRDHLWEKCGDVSWRLFIPLMVTSFVSTFFIPYILIYTIKNLPFERKVDTIIFIILPSIGGLLYGLAKAGLIHTNDSSYFFYIAYYTNIVCSMGLPLVNIYRVNHKEGMKATKEVFIKLLFDKNFFILLKEQSIQLFCVENALFWEMHQMLMSVVFNYYLASNSEKRRNRLLQKKSSSKIDNDYPRYSSIPLNGHKSVLNNERKLSIDNFYLGGSEDINIVINKNDKSDSQIRSNSSINNSKEFNNYNIYDNAVINFINEKNITFLEDSYNEMDVSDQNTKADIIFNLIFKQFCLTNNIKLTKKESSIESFLIDENLTKYYQKIFDIFIDPNGISPLNIPNSVYEEVKRDINQKNYSHKVFKSVLIEVVDMMYRNVYLSSLKRMHY